MVSTSVREDISLGCGFRDFGSMLVAPGDEEHEGYANAYCAVSHIEGGKAGFVSTPLHEIEAQKINDVLAKNAVDEITHNASDDEAKSELAQERVRVEMVAAEKQNDQRNNRDNRQCSVFPGERTPGRARVLPVHELEEARQNQPFIPYIGKKVQDELLCDLVEREDNECDHRDTAVGRA